MERKARVLNEAEAISWLEKQTREIERHDQETMRVAMQQASNSSWRGILGSSPVNNSYLLQYPATWEEAIHKPITVVEEPSLESIHTVPVTVEEVSLEDERKQLAMEAEAVLGYCGLRQKTGAPSTLRTLLARLEIEVWNAAEVQAYKQQMCDHCRTAGKMFDPTWTVVPISDYTEPIPDFVIAKAIEIKKELPQTEFYVEYFREDPFLLVTTRKPKMGDLGRHGQFGAKAVNYSDEVMYLDVWNEKSFEAEH